VLPEGARAALAGARGDLERLLIVSGLASVFAMVAVGFAIFADVSFVVWLPAAVGADLIALVAYRGAVQAAVGYGELLRSCYDLYRRDLLKQMGFVLPKKFDDQKELWVALSQHVYRGAAFDPAALKLSGGA
jgi:hypothetical protein